MKRVTSIATACAAAVLLTLTVSVGAQDFNMQEKTFLTFSNPVELPGMTLPAGTYTFKLADTPTRNIVQVLSQDEMEVHGQFLFLQAQRPEVTGETVITFRETQENATPAVQYWYYPGEKIGKEFIYPKDQAMQIAARTGSPVRTEEGLVSADGTVTSTDAQGQVTEWQREETTAAAAEAPVEGAAGISAQSPTDNAGVQADATATTPAADAQAETAVTTPAADAQAEVAVTTPAPEPAAETAQVAADSRPADDTAVGTSGVQAESTEARAELPRTASPLALSGLLGLLSLAGAFGLRAFRG